MSADRLDYLRGEALDAGAPAERVDWHLQAARDARELGDWRTAREHEETVRDLARSASATNDGSATTLALVWCLVTLAAAVPLLLAAHARLSAVAETLATLPA